MKLFEIRSYASLESVWETESGRSREIRCLVEDRNGYVRHAIIVKGNQSFYVEHDFVLENEQWRSRQHYSIYDQGMFEYSITDRAWKLFIAVSDDYPQYPSFKN